MSPASHRKVILSAAQLAPAPEGKSATLDKALTAIAEAARAGSHLIAFPEVFLNLTHRPAVRAQVQGGLSGRSGNA